MNLQCFGSCATALHWQFLDCITLVVVFVLLVVGRLHSIGSCKISLHRQLVDFIALAVVTLYWQFLDGFVLIFVRLHCIGCWVNELHWQFSDCIILIGTVWTV